MSHPLLLATAIVLSFASSVNAEGYIAFSLRQASVVLQGGSSEVKGQALSLSGITRPHALIHDVERGDLIVVGERDPNMAALTLDDWAVAARSEFVVRRDPVVSIDQTTETPKTRQQIVRFEGALKDTQFGTDLLAADIVLKRLGLGKVTAEIFGVSSFLKLTAASYKTNPSEPNDFTRFWFLPMRSESYVYARNGVIVVEEYRIDVQNQRYIEGATSKKPDSAIRSFAQGIRTNFDDVKLSYPALARMEQLYYLTALAQGAGTLGIKPSDPAVKYWLDAYKIRYVPTPSTYPLEENSTEVALNGGRRATIWLSGGIDLDAMIVHLEDGLPDALKQYVLASRPSQAALAWDVPLVSLSWAHDIDRAAIDFARSKLKNKRDLGMSIQRQIAPFHGGHSAAFQPIPSHIPTAEFRFAPSQIIPPSMPDRHLRSITPHVGGVMLSGAAKIMDNKPMSMDTSKLFSLVASGDNARLSRNAHRQFVTALWSTYYSKDDPGISIDPIAMGADKQLVRYIGRVINTDLGRVMREADYLMKKWAVGTEKPPIPGFRDVDTISGGGRITFADAFRRFWFVPEDMTFKGSDGMFLFDHGRMTVKTEILGSGKKGRALEGDRIFARFFTDHYDEIAAKYPIFKDLFEYAKLVSLAKYLKQQGVPLHWFLMAHLDDVITEDSVGSVNTLSKGSKYLKDARIEGGVEMNGRYVLDASASAAIQRALSRIDQPRKDSPRTVPGTARPVVPHDHGTFTVEKQVFSIVPQHSATSGIDRRGIRYQTDVAIRQGREPGLELVRYFRPSTHGVYSKGEFGNGWHLLRPYRIVPVGKPTVPFLNVLIPAKVAVRNLVTGQDEILTFDDKKYKLAGYRPADMASSRLVGLFWTVAGGMRLVDKLGNEFWFNEGLMLSEMHFSDEFGMQFEYGYEEAGRKTYGRVPYRLEPEGKGVTHDIVTYGPDGKKRPLPDKLRLTDSVSGGTKLFRFGENDAGLLGYIYDAPNPLDREFIALRGDGVHILVNANGSEVWFNQQLEFLKWRPLLVKAVIQGAYKWKAEIKDIEFVPNHTAQLDYEFADGAFRVAGASVLKQGLSTAIHRIAYRYAEDSMLASASTR